MDPASAKVISLTHLLEFEFDNSGNVLKNAICLGDVDNDGLNELIVGNDKGDLAIFKGDQTRSKPSILFKCGGVISALAVGDVLNIGKNVLVVITGCGLCYVFDISKETFCDISRKPLIPLHTQRIPSNVKVVLIGDINGDGFHEIIVGLTDRVVRTYRWVQSSFENKLIGKFLGLNKWEFAEQIGTITINKSADQKPCILVSQPSGTFISLKVDPHYHHQPDDVLDEPSEALLTKITLVLEPLTSSKFHNSEISGNVKLQRDLKFEDMSEGSPFAVATLDGVLMLVQDGQILWNYSVDQELFAVSSLDLNEDGNDEIVACSWDGTTYIVDHETNCAKFFFKESVNTFVAGMFGLKNKQVNCFIYVTFNNRIVLYYDIHVSCSQTKSILETLTANQEYNEFVHKLGLNIADTQSLKKLNKYILYNHFSK